jgi:chitin disaccharide deacetylase
MSRAVIINADDFGQSAGITRGIVEAHERGIVTSASLMVRGNAASGAAAYARAHPALSVGLHIDLGESVFRDGEWVPLYQRVNRQDIRELETEIWAQLSIFRKLLGRDPTHLDSHQHVHIEEPAQSIVDRVGSELGVPVRHRAPHLRYDGRFYGQTGTGDPLPANITTARLMELLRELPVGVTEMACHPGYPEDVVTMYGAEREMELHALCDPDVRRVLREEAIELIAFSDLREY